MDTQKLWAAAVDLNGLDSVGWDKKPMLTIETPEALEELFGTLIKAISEEWVSVETRLPPACSTIWAFRQPRPGASRVVDFYRTNTHPRECVEDDLITHWKKLDRPEAP